MSFKKEDFKDLKINNIKPFTDWSKYKGFVIEWSSPSIGFGEYQLFFDKVDDDYILWADTEHMDKENSKEFTKAILDLLVNEIRIYD